MRRTNSRLSCVLFAILALFLAAAGEVRAEVVEVTEPLAGDATWTAGNEWIVNPAFTVPAGMTLTIEPGTVVKFRNCVTPVYGKVVADGTSSPITLTSVDDNSVGSPTGTGTPVVGYAGFSLYPESTASVFRNAVFRYGNFGLYIRSTSTVIVDGCSFTDSAQGIMIESSSPAVTNNYIEATDRGIYNYLGRPVIRNNVISGTNCCIESLGGDLVIEDNTVSNYIFIHLDFGNSGSPLIRRTTYTGADSETGILLVGTLREDMLVTKDERWAEFFDFSISEGVTLTIEPGVVIKKGDFYVLGTLRAEGTPEEPIIFTSINDNTVGGATGSGDPVLGEGCSFSFGESSAGVFKNAVVKYAEQFDIGSSSVSITDCRFGPVAGAWWGILIEDASPTLTNNVFEADEVWRSEIRIRGGDPVLLNNTVEGRIVIEWDPDAPTAPLIRGTVFVDLPNEAEGIFLFYFTCLKDMLLTSGGPWIVEGGLTVPEGITLTIEPGAKVDFITGSGENSLTVEGTLIADGTLPGGGTDPIMFNAGIEPYEGYDGAGQIVFRTTSTGSVLKNVDLRYFDGIKIYSSSVAVSECQFHDNNDALRIYESSPTLTRNTFTAGAFETHIVIAGGDPVLLDNTVEGAIFVNNYVELEDYTWYERPTAPVIRGTVFVDLPNQYEGIVLSYFTCLKDMLLTSGGPWLVEHSLTVPDGITLTIEPGALVGFSNSYGENSLTVEGTLIADGTLPGGGTDPILFNSGPEPYEDYRGAGNVVFTSTSTAVLKNVDMRSFNDFKIFSTSVTISECRFHDNYGALYIYESSPTLSRNTFTVGGGYETHIIIAGGDPVLLDNTVDGIIDVSNIVPVDDTTWYERPTSPVIRGTVFTDLPYQEEGIRLIDFKCLKDMVLTEGGPWIVELNLTVIPGVTLTIEPGTLVKLSPTFEHTDDSWVNVEGTLIANGTTAAPIMFTSRRDGSAWESDFPEAGDWKAIRFFPASSGNVFSNVLVKYGSLDNTLPGLLVESTDVSLSNVKTLSEETPAPVLSAPGGQSVKEGLPLSFSLSATDPLGRTLTYAAHNLPSGASFNEATGTFSWTPDYSQAGTYKVIFTAKNGVATHSHTGTITVTNDTVPPLAPNNVAAAALSPTSISLGWNDRTADESGFRILRSLTSAGTYEEIAAVGRNVTAYTDTGLTPSTYYYYRVKSLKGTIESAASNTGYAKTLGKPAAPASLTATALGATSIALTWTDNSTTETGFKISRSLASAGPYADVATAPANAVSWTDTGLTPSTYYYYRVRAANEAGDSANSNTGYAKTLGKPAAPSNLTATVSNPTSIALSWTDNSANETGFRISRSVVAAGTYTDIATVGANVASFTDTGLNWNLTYYYRVRATNEAGDSANTSTAYAKTLRETPAMTPSGGTFTAAQSVAIAVSNPSAAIRYTTDGSTPSTTNGTVYAGAVEVARSVTIKAIAYTSASNVSDVASAVFTMTDSDGDGLSDAEEDLLGTDPSLADSDGDTLGDGEEVNLYNTDPLDVDSDSDTYGDGHEVLAGSDPASDADKPEYVEPVTGIVMVYVPAGTFTMGDEWGDGRAGEQPVHLVTITRGYYLGKHEVAQAKYQQITGVNPSASVNPVKPVETVSWDNAKAFITQLNLATGKTFRLPTEAEWEYAAKGGPIANNKYAGTSDSTVVGPLFAWYLSNSSGVTHAVGTKYPNELGLYDMNGNVGEWVNDWYTTYTAESQTDPTGKATGTIKLIRGGHRGSAVTDIRNAYRTSGYPATTKNSVTGFRLAMEP